MTAGVDAMMGVVAFDLAGVDWKAVGAVAGPALALLALAWQASERLQRPVLAARYSPQVMEAGAMDGSVRDRYVTLHGTVRAVNPRPSALVVLKVEMQAREGWRRRALLDDATRVAQIPPHDEVEFSCYHGHIRDEIQVRMRVKLRGRRRWLATHWISECGRSLELAACPDFRPGGWGAPSGEPYPSASASR